MLTDKGGGRLIIRNNWGIPHRKLKYFSTKLRCKIRRECCASEWIWNICVAYALHVQLSNFVAVECSFMFLFLPLSVSLLTFDMNIFWCMPISFVVCCLLVMAISCCISLKQMQKVLLAHYGSENLQWKLIDKHMWTRKKHTKQSKENIWH